MTTEIKLWKIEKEGSLQAVKGSKLDLEERLESWLERDITLLSSDLLVIGRQVPTDFGGMIDLLCLDSKGDTAIIELKRDKTPREITAQIIDYASWVKDLSNETITNIADRYWQNKKGISLEEAFQEKFNIEIPDVLNESHSMLVVAAQIDPASERIIKYLSDTYSVNINAATFQYFKENADREYLARVFLVQPETYRPPAPTSKRNPNLSLEDLRAIANEKGVGDLHASAVTALEKHFNSKNPTRGQLTFNGNIRGSRRAIFSLIPVRSSQEDGLRFFLYLSRLMDYLGVNREAITSILPEHRVSWEIPDQNDEWGGEKFEDCFQTDSELKRFVDGLAKLRHHS